MVDDFGAAAAERAVQRPVVVEREQIGDVAIAAWNVFTYATFTKNLAAAHAQGEVRPAGYWIAHSVLIVVNLVIAGVLGRLGDRARPATREPPRVDA